MPDLWTLVRGSLLRVAQGLDFAARTCAWLAAAFLQMRDIRSDAEMSWGNFNTLDADVDRGLFWWEELLVNRFVKPPDRILVVGCGTGRDLVALSARGHHVTGVEPAPAAVARAREECARRGVAATVVHGYFEDVVLTTPFDMIILSWCCYGYIPESARRIDVLRKARALLTPGGRILLSYAGNRERHRSTRFAFIERAAWLRRSDWHPEEGDVIHPIFTGRPRFHYEHIFAPGEVEAEASAAGLRTIFHDDSSFDLWVAVLAT